ncbi:MAG: SpoIIE family protein phosphatase [Crocinitomicaceae bacterium]|nr:SpoIIE family protein phosphatase [Crocinitomicaceae bacterium]
MLRVVLLSILLISVNGIAQQFHFKKYSLEEGLSRSGVYYILQDNAGFLWVGTEGGGVCKFDGKTFTNYTRHNGLASENVRVIFQDDRNILWFGTANGLSYFNGKKFVSLTTEDGLADNFVRSITQDHEGNIWIGTNKGISIIDPDEKGVSGKLNFNFSLPHMKVRSIHAQGKRVWIGTDRGLCKFENNKISIITEAHGLSNDLILNLYEDKKGNLWVGTQEGLNKITHEGDSIESWTLLDGLVHNRVRSITEDMYGQMWIGTSGGISIFTGEEFIPLSEQNGLSNERIRCITHDSFDNIWIGTFFGGIMKFNHQDFISYTPSEGLVSNQILSINEDEKGDIIVGTYDGVSKLQIENDQLVGSRTVNLENGLYSNSVRSVLKDEHGKYWYGTNLGITIIGGDSITQINEEDGLINTEVNTIKKYNGKYWVGTYNGLGIIEETEDYEHFQVKFIRYEDGLAGREVSHIVQDGSGDVWVAFVDGKLSVFHDDKIVNPVVPKSLDEVLSLAVDSKGRIWIGTNGNGLFYGNHAPSSHQLNLKNISKTDGLVSNSIYSLLIVNDEIWAGHENGIDLVTWESDSVYSVRSFGPESGFFGMQNNLNASYQDSNGNLWFGTVNGLFCLKSREIKQFTSGVPSINYISNIKIGGEKINWSESEWCKGVKGQYNLPSNLELPYNKNNISFDFIGLNFVHPNKIKYSWKLDGFDEQWCAPTSKNYAAYTNLEPGDYTFRLKSSDEHGIIKGEPISYSFTIEKPFWSTWGFRITAGVFAGLLIWLITRIRTRQLIRKQRALEKIIKERTKEIQSQADELQLKNKEVTDSILYSKRIQGSILPGKEKLKRHLRDHFVFYKPKDIVSGDFYWAEVSRKNPKIKFFAAVDCTGHGVPGAMVSLIGTRALTASINEAGLINTNEILDSTNKIVVEAFTDAQSGEIIKDGMDLALCSLDYSNEKQVKFQFAGAQNPAWIIRKETEEDLEINGSKILPNLVENGYKLFEIKGDKQPIGYFEGGKPFHRAEGFLKPGDRIYLFTDGFADQFGGKKGKKFKYKTLKQLILGSQQKSMAEQKDVYRSAFLDWKQDIEQVDDVCLMGVQV